MKARGWLLPLGIVAAVGLLVAGFFALFERVTTTEPLPPSGEARYNPLYALGLAMKARGVTVRSHPSLDPSALALGPNDTLLLYTTPEAITEAQADRLIAWVRKGGHLVMPGPGAGTQPGPLPEAFGLTAVEPPPTPPDKDGEEAEAPNPRTDCTPLVARTMRGLRAPPVKPVKPAKPVKPVKPDDAAPEAPRLCGARFTSEVEGFRMHAGDEQAGYRFGRLALDRGVVTVVSSLRLLGNDRLRQPAAVELAEQILAPRLGAGAMHLVYSADLPSLWRLLLEHAWRALLPAALALLAWLLWRGQRFGPALPPPPENRRALLEHVQAAGEFAFRRGRMAALHSAVLELFQRRLALRDPVLSALEGETLAAALSERFGLPRERVLRALRPVGLQRPDVFLAALSTLVQMRNRL